MKRERIPETDRGIQGEANVASYDEFMRYMRDGNRLQIEELASMDFKGPGSRTRALGCGPCLMLSLDSGALDGVFSS